MGEKIFGFESNFLNLHTIRHYGDTTKAMKYRIFCMKWLDGGQQGIFSIENSRSQTQNTYCMFCIIFDWLNRLNQDTTKSFYCVAQVDVYEVENASVDMKNGGKWLLNLNLRSGGDESDDFIKHLTMFKITKQRQISVKPCCHKHKLLLKERVRSAIIRNQLNIAYKNNNYAKPHFY